MNDLKNLNAYITGGSRGIGKVIATQLAQSGVNIAIISRNQSESGELAAQLQRDYGVQTWSFATDVSRPESELGNSFQENYVVTLPNQS